MRAWRHDDVPIGGTLGGLIGAIEGVAIGQVRGGQIGGMSSELPHSGCISPSTHWQVQDASARALISTAIQTAIVTRFIALALSRTPPSTARTSAAQTGVPH
jgi:hypothetical protein